eukprot:3240421-Pyramimonas_sp.AAC.1
MGLHPFRDPRGSESPPAAQWYSGTVDTVVQSAVCGSSRWLMRDFPGSHRGEPSRTQWYSGTVVQRVQCVVLLVNAWDFPGSYRGAEPSHMRRSDTVV